MFTLLEGDAGGIGGVLSELWEYLQATFLRADIGGDGFQGATFRRAEGALEVIADGFPVDAFLLGGGLVLGVLGGVAGGLVVGMRPRSWAARGITATTAILLASPVYWLGFMVLVLFAPQTGRILEVPFVSAVGSYQPLSEDPLQFLQSMWIPWLVVAAPLAAAATRMCAGQLAEVMGEEYLRTARAKGLPERRVLRRHALPAASAPVIALVGVNVNLMITNIALMESAFNLPGSFRYIERALVDRDVDLAQGMVLEATFLIVLANFVADGVQAWLDPRIRHG
jgi:peptide/nickel transport system permease protein